jgi:hypothetical protein
MMRIQLTRKLANRINGVDLSERHVGDIIELPPREADVLLAEEWARPVADDRQDQNSAPGSRGGSRRPPGNG